MTSNPNETDRTILDTSRHVVIDPQSLVRVRNERTQGPATAEQALWIHIRQQARGISFDAYKAYVDGILCCQKGAASPSNRCELRLPFPGIDAYTLLKVATQAFLLQQCGCISTSPCCEDESDSDGTGDAGECGETADESDFFDEKGNVVKRKGSKKLLGSMPTVGDERRALEEASRGISDALQPLERLKRFLIALDREGLAVLPYMKQILERFPAQEIAECEGMTDGVLRSKLLNPCLLELIWSYWHEEGMLVQTMNALSRRFQNLRGPRESDPLSRLDLNPLRPLNNLLWGYIQDEQHRLTVVRRAYEYDHHYGLRIYGKAVPELESADSRSKFLEAFHTLLNRCADYYRESSDTNVIPDGFPLLNALKETHLLLAEGAHNQFGDLPWTARHEMLMQEWLLARPEMQEFLGGRAMVPYLEPWMDRVDSMKRLQGWTDVPVTHFRDLGVFGEQILLGIRWGNWNAITNEGSAKNWADYFKQEIQAYLHAYRAVTGADLTTEPVDYRLPAQLIRDRARITAGADGFATGRSLPAGSKVLVRSKSDART